MLALVFILTIGFVAYFDDQVINPKMKSLSRLISQCSSSTFQHFLVHTVCDLYHRQWIGYGNHHYPRPGDGLVSPSSPNGQFHNITAELDLLLYLYRIGDSIIVADGDDIEGKILEIKMLATNRQPSGNC
ncbi:hypothetical protein O9993_00270 [Vibrio lentus]|nr:hypothetical protein [Vibrio lentus]